MAIQLSDHFNFNKIIRFTVPTIMMMVFVSIYSVVDGFFISNYAGVTQFAAINLIFPFITVFASVGYMFGTGGSALVAKILGQGDREKANNVFSLIFYAGIVSSIVISVILEFLMDDVALMLGATEALLPYSSLYGRILVAGSPFFFLQTASQSFLVVDEKPKLAMWVIVGAGLTNMFLDWLFLAVFHWGVAGAAAATCFSMFAGGSIPLFVFIFSKNSNLRLGHATLRWSVLGKACLNGLSELLSTIAMGIVGIFYNVQLLKFMGEKGVAIYGILMYVAFIFASIFYGYVIGIGPVISFHFGAKNSKELSSLLKKSLFLVAAGSVGITAFAELCSPFLVKIFIGKHTELCSQGIIALRLYSFAFLFAGFNIFASAFFTALNDGITSGIISVLRVLGFEITAIFVMPLIFGVNGIWTALTTAEIMSLVVSSGCIIGFRKKYGY